MTATPAAPPAATPRAPAAAAPRADAVEDRSPPHRARAGCDDCQGQGAQVPARRHGRVAFHTALLCTRPQCTAAGSYRSSFLRTAQYHECESCFLEAQRSNAVLRDVIWISSRANSSRLSGFNEAMSRQEIVETCLEA